MCVGEGDLRGSWELIPAQDRREAGALSQAAMDSLAPVLNYGQGEDCLPEQGSPAIRRNTG